MNWEDMEMCIDVVENMDKIKVAFKILKKFEDTDLDELFRGSEGAYSTIIEVEDVIVLD